MHCNDSLMENTSKNYNMCKLPTSFPKLLKAKCMGRTFSGKETIKWNSLRIVHDYCECHRHRIFNDDILSSNICIPLLSVFLSKKEKYNRKIKGKKNKHTKELHQPGIELGTSRSPVLHVTTALMHTLKNYYRKSLLKQWWLPKL